MLRGLSIKAILLGVIADWVMSLVVGFAVGILFVIYVVATTKAAPAPHAFTALLETDTACAITCIVGGLFTLIPGFFTGWLAKFSRVKNALAMGVVSAASSLVFLPFSQGYPVWYFPVAAVSTIVFAAIGGYFANLAFGVRSTDHPTPPPPSA